MTDMLQRPVAELLVLGPLQKFADDLLGEGVQILDALDLAE
jgi:hypothetical protein